MALRWYTIGPLRCNPREPSTSPGSGQQGPSWYRRDRVLGFIIDTCNYTRYISSKR
ncbi:hypothetical protein M413DRAFT_442338 [Hebeloma cylindrosporum]|uniref:Uncharacterized protein n=1 Tax=Hebeloma cylindrosporum TaxID=76867 RepID=A0A0C3CPH7_HEBCY|nr:hypothetical protein M413DRAFT_442338 [Hebeloma cylindrosporum h7]